MISDTGIDQNSSDVFITLASIVEWVEVSTLLSVDNNVCAGGGSVIST